MITMNDSPEAIRSDIWCGPLFRWAGSKRKLLPELLKAVPTSFHRYVEPFAGSACLFFALRPTHAVLGDINEELLRTYSIIREHPILVHRHVSEMPTSSLFYYELRATDPANLEPVERAARFVYLNRHCFNGVYRTNKDGRFNVPRGTRTGEVPLRSTFLRVAAALRTAELRPSDFEACISDVGMGDFVYLDPPYARKTVRWRGEYGNDSFKTIDVPRLKQTLRSIDHCGAHFLLSYALCNEIKELTQEWHSKRILVRRHVAGFGKDRRGVYEVLVSNRSVQY